MNIYIRDVSSGGTIAAMSADMRGNTDESWSRKHEAREQLIAVAKRPGTITYGELASKVRSISFAADDDPFHKLLGQISIEENDAGPLRSLGSRQQFFSPSRHIPLASLAACTNNRLMLTFSTLLSTACTGRPYARLRIS
jgi:hypothetical protein